VPHEFPGLQPATRHEIPRGLPQAQEERMPSICIVTPTYGRDIMQFSLLRRSINAFAPGFPQLAIVNTDDYAAFRDRLAGEADLEIVKSADVLPGLSSIAAGDPVRSGAPRCGACREG
jgi:DNA-binding transcriptional LysR family regulator